LERLVVESGTPISIADFARSEYPAPHPEIQSALIVPIMHQHRHAGLICMHGRQVGQFDETAMEITQSLAVQAAVALNNALAYEEQTRRGVTLKRELETLSRLIQVSRVPRSSQSLVQSLQEIAQAIQSATPFQVVLISIYDPASQSLQRTVSAGVSPELWEELRVRLQPWRSLQQLFQPEFKVGNVFYITEEKVPAILQDIHVVSVLPASEAPAENSWHSQDLLLIPLYDVASNPLGLISVDAPLDNLRPDQITLNALEVFAVQASTMLESQQRAGRLERQIEDLEHERARLENAAVQANRNLPLMLHKELEQAIALRGLNQRIDRVRATLEIAALANRQSSEGEVLQTLANGLLTRFALQYALIAEKNPAGIRLVETVG
ncbi:MAG: GAF domain-containing protein, partial [Anaerolineaceae bacterium]|nr:GAF domain-containing protein [Anaerolineaceae bacterium]